jgi:hypothetical protein
MGSLTVLLDRLGRDLRGWRELDLPALVFAHRTEALMTAVILVGLSTAALLARLLLQSRPGRNQIIVPALLDWHPRSRLSFIRHAPLILFLAGLPLLFAALADPHTAVAQRQVTFPGRRIALLIDASSSMMVPFPTSRLRQASANEAVFLTNTAAAASFVKQRKSGHYRDLIALVEFGDEAYVITPFTSDYDNLLVSISMIGDWSEYMQFPDGGTTISRAIDRATGLFKAFDFLHAAGNVLVIFSDGEDTQVTTRGQTLSEVLAAAIETRIPVYLVRTSRRDGRRCHSRDSRHRSPVDRPHRGDAVRRPAAALRRVCHPGRGVLGGRRRVEADGADVHQVSLGGRGESSSRIDGARDRIPGGGRRVVDDRAGPAAAGRIAQAAADAAVRRAARRIRAGGGGAPVCAPLAVDDAVRRRPPAPARDRGLLAA